MCGRYVVTNAVTKTKNIVKTAINVQDSDNYNAHPYQNLPVLKKYKNGNTVENLKWGIIPSWAKQKDFKPLINARLETIENKGALERNVLNELKFLTRSQMVSIRVPLYLSTTKEMQDSLPY